MRLKNWTKKGGRQWKGFPKGYKSTLEKGRTSFISREHTGVNRNKEIINLIQPLLKIFKKKEIIINDIGVGSVGICKKDGTETGKITTHEPYELTQMAINAGKNPETFGYTIKQDIASKLNKKLVTNDMKNLKRKVNFSAMDILTSTPSKRADLTFCLNTLTYTREASEKQAAVKNLASSTIKGGILVIDVPLSKKQEKLFGLLKIDEKDNRISIDNTKFGDSKIIVYKKINDS